MDEEVATQHKFVPKGWGYEKWITNNEKYCGKLLHFVKGRRCSWHYHEMKDEVIYVQSGAIRLLHGKTDLMEEAQDSTLYRGDSFRLFPGIRHQMIALEDSEIFEFSTTHHDSDSVRIEKGD